MSSDNLSFEDQLTQLLENDTEGLLATPEKSKPITATDRLERAFLEIVEFRREHGRLPSAETLDISERKLGARLDGFLNNEAKADAVRHLDEFDMLSLPEAPTSLEELLTSDLDRLDLLNDDSGLYDFSAMPELQREPDEFDVAQRKKAEDFEKFEHLFRLKHRQLKAGELKLSAFGGVSTIKQGRFFVLGGVMLYVAEVGETEMVKNGDRKVPKERLRVIFENGTESSMYRQSLAGRLGEQDGRSLASAHHQNFAEQEVGEDFMPDGYIYVLKSQSKDPAISQLPNLHKIGFSRGAVEQRIAQAEKDPTYLMAPVEVVAAYAVKDLQAAKLEHLLHRVFAEVRLDITMTDADGKPYTPSEWFMVPRATIDRAIQMVISGDIVDFLYSKETGKLVWNG